MNQKPLAERMRPRTLADYAGQKHLVGDGEVLYNMLKADYLPSLILWGPPGVGKTTLANIIASEKDLPFYMLSATDAGVKQVRGVIEIAEKHQKAMLFIDEIHRFSKSQQDSLLKAVENGTIVLIGATTENPSFEVIAPLLSRCQVYVLQSMNEDELKQLAIKAIEQDAVLSEKQVEIQEFDALIAYSGGDARKLYNLLELVCNHKSSGKIIITNELVSELARNFMSRYDKKGEQHYDIISAFIKSMRGSDVNAALYWLARMTNAGEDPKFIARRMLILASEDIGNANPTALVMANNCFQAVNVVGYPECSLILSQTAIYLACSAKSNASYLAIKRAQKLAKENGDLPVPLHLRNAPTKLMKKLAYGEQYQYAHDHPRNFVEQEYMPDKMSGHRIYEPGNNARELEMRKKLKMDWKEKYGY